MPFVNYKNPTCPYGNQASYVCVNSKCRKPGLICQKGQSSKSQCWLFHEDCQKIKWTEVQQFAKENNLTKSAQFLSLQSKMESLFLRGLQKIQSEHQKFKIWTRTYGHSLQTMKLIKLLMESNYEQLTGDYMSTILPVLSNNEPKRIQIPTVAESQLQSIRQEIDSVFDKISMLYLRSKKNEKNINFGNNTANQFQFTESASFSSQFSTTQKQNINLSQKEHANDYPSSASLSPLRSSANGLEFKSKIIDSFSQIYPYFQGRSIKTAKLIYRASQHNFSIKKFHELCDNVSDTLLLVHNEYGKKFGGYTPVPWKSEKKHWAADKSLKSFIFSMDMGQKFKLNLAQFAIASNPQRGPTFGCCDICIVDNSNKQKSNCEFPISYNIQGKYVRSQATSTLFTGNAKGQFIIRQWQVFRLQFNTQ